MKRIQLSGQNKESEIEKSLARFSQHLMSDSKWVRLLHQLVKHADKVKKVEFKKIQSDKIGQLFINENTSYEFDYWKNGFEGNNSFGGWLLYKEIEYLFFPSDNDNNQGPTQNIEYMMEVINSVGEFELEKNENGLKLIAYKE